MLNNKTILVTGGTGSFGKQFIKTILHRYSPRKVIVFSRDELKQFEMQQSISDDRIRYFLGDVRDKDRLHRALNGVEIVVHAAALKQVPAAEYNPFEAVKTNIIGAENIISESIDNNVEKVIALSTDKAVSPVNLYGATKLCAERLFIAGNNYVGESRSTILSNVRYGNVMGSRGSAIPYFFKIRHTGQIPITDPRMTRFWITLEASVDFVLSSLEMMTGGETFIPKIPTMSIMDLANIIAPDCEKKIIGIRPGEKLHETLLTGDESRDSYDLPDRYIICPQKPSSTKWGLPDDQISRVEESFHYNSANAPDKLSQKTLLDALQK